MNSKILSASVVLVPVVLMIMTFVFLSPKLGFVLFPVTDE
jgi:hypothetical protein